MAELELAANISQFVVYGKILISNAIQIYQSASGVAQENAEIELAADNFKQSREKLKNQAHDSCDETLLKLCRLSNDIAHDMLDELNKLKIPDRNEGSGKKRKLSCLWMAARGAWKKDYIQAQKKRLEYLEKEIIAYVTVDHRDRFLQYTEKNTKDLEKLSLQGEIVLNALSNNADIIEAVRRSIEDPIKNLQDEGSRHYRGRYLEKLPIASSAQFNSYERRHRSSCLPHTREETLSDIRRWIDGDDEKSIFWLNGLAGTGKSTIASTVAQEYYEESRLGGSFFFSKDVGGDVTRARKFFTTLARQLARVSKAIFNQISEVIAEDESIVDQSLPAQWRKLIFNPLSGLDKESAHETLLFVVDALDECGDFDDVETIVRALAESRSLTTLRLRVLLTSRSYFKIKQGFRNISKTNYEDFILHEISRKIVDRDIGILVKTRFETIRVMRQFEVGWPGSKTVDAIIQRAKGLFIWADTACRFVEEGGLFINRRLMKLLEEDNYKVAPEQRLDSLYLTVLVESVSPKNVLFDMEELEEYCKVLRTALGSIVTMFSSVSMLSLGKLTGIDMLDISDCLEKFTAILDIREDYHSPIKLHHPSFRDFLLSQNRCVDERFAINEAKAHASLAFCSMEIMSSELKRNICEIRQPGKLVKDLPKGLVENCVSEALQYACQYWVYHLHKSKEASEIQNSFENELDMKAYGFLRAHLTHWLEVLGLIGRTSESIHSIKLLEALVPQSSKAYDFIYDARRFIESSIQIVELAPLQIYCTSLLFAPQKSLVRNQFQNEIPRGIDCLTATVEKWNAVYHNLEGHTFYMTLLEFSADDMQLNSLAADNTFARWDVSTGQALHFFQYEEGAQYVSTAVSLSSDLLATFASGKLKLWDLMTGLELKTLEVVQVNHLNGFRVVFSNNGKFIASTRNDNYISLWDTVSGTRKSTLAGHLHDRRPLHLKFSPDDTYLAWNSVKCPDRTYIECCNIQSPGGVGPITILEVAGKLLSFDLSNTHLLTKRSENYIDIWSLHSQTIIRTLRTFHELMGSFLTSHNLLSLSTEEHSLEIWNVATLRMSVTLKQGLKEKTSAGVFSPDGSIFAQLCDDKLFLWDLNTGHILHTIINRYFANSAIFEFSHDNKLLAVGHYDGTIQLLDLKDGAFSLLSQKAPDNTVVIDDDDDGDYDDDGEFPKRWMEHIIAIGNLDLLVVPRKYGIIEIRSFEKGNFFRKIKAHDSELHGLDYLVMQNRKLLISYCASTLRQWEIPTGKEVIEPIKNDGVLEIIKSHDGELLLVVASDNCTIYDTSLTEEFYFIEFEGHYCAMAISADKSFVAITYSDSVELRNLQSGKVVFVRDTTDDTEARVAFTSDSDAIAYEITNGKIGIWRIYALKEQVIMSGESENALSLAFSPNNSYLASIFTESSPNRSRVNLYNVATGDTCAKVTVLGNTLYSYFQDKSLYFSDDGHYLNYFWGQLCVGCLTSEVKSKNLPTCQKKGLILDGPWIMQGLEKVLWLPSRYRSLNVRARGDIILMKHDFNRMTKLRIDVHRDDFWDM